MKSDIRLEELIEITIELMILNSIKSLDDQKISRKDQKNIWNQICSKYFNDGYTFKDAVNLRSWWERNTCDFRKLLIRKMHGKEMRISGENDDEKTISKSIKKSQFFIKLSFNEWFNVQSLIGKYKRKKFKSGFDDFLTERLQNLNVKCYLRCKYNWFSESNNLSKPNDNLWRGLYVCIDPNCHNKFEAKIKQIPIQNHCLNTLLDNDCCTIEIIFDQKTLHQKKLSKKPRCSGSTRKETALNLMSRGVLNIQSENIIMNKMSQNGKKNF